MVKTCNSCKTILVLVACSALFTISGCKTGLTANIGEAESVRSIELLTAKEEGLKKVTDHPTFAQLVDTYGDVGLIDAHNHDAAHVQYPKMRYAWNQYKVRNVVLFGNVSEPSAIETDASSWNAYQRNPDFFIPFFFLVSIYMTPKV